MGRHGFATLAIILCILAAAVVVCGIWWSTQNFHTRKIAGENVPSSTSPANVVLLASSSSAVSDISATSSDTTSSWLTYTDPQNGFSFQYPQDCQVNTSTYSSSETEVIVLKGTTPQTCSMGLLAILIYHKAKSESLLDYWRSVTDLAVLSSSTTTVNGYPALSIEGLEPPPQSGEGEQVDTSDLLLTKDNIIFVDFAPSPFDTVAQNGDLVPEQILDSFKF